MKETLQAVFAFLMVLLFIAVFTLVGIALDLYSKQQGWFG
jgi:preprotein translocase subunit SecE